MQSNIFFKLVIAMTQINSRGFLHMDNDFLFTCTFIRELNEFAFNKLAQKAIYILYNFLCTSSSSVSLLLFRSYRNLLLYHTRINSYLRRKLCNDINNFYSALVCRGTRYQIDSICSRIHCQVKNLHLSALPCLFQKWENSRRQ